MRSNIFCILREGCFAVKRSLFLHCMFGLSSQKDSMRCFRENLDVTNRKINSKTSQKLSGMSHLFFPGLRCTSVRSYTQPTKRKKNNSKASLELMALVLKSEEGVISVAGRWAEAQGGNTRSWWNRHSTPKASAVHGPLVLPLVPPDPFAFLSGWSLWVHQATATSWTPVCPGPGTCLGAWCHSSETMAVLLPGRSFSSSTSSNL